MVLGQHDKTALLLALTAVSLALSSAQPVSAEEPVLQLAILKAETIPSHALQPTRPTARISLRTQPPAPAKPPTPANPDLESFSIQPTGETNIVLLSTNQEPFRTVLVPEPGDDSEAERGGLLANARIQAGLGQIFNDRPDVIYGRNGTKLEEPSCGYLKISIPF